MHKSDWHYERIEKLADKLRHRKDIAATIDKMEECRREDFKMGIRFALMCIVDDEVDNFTATSFDIGVQNES